jgi:hypothetical protein
MNQSPMVSGFQIRRLAIGALAESPDVAMRSVVGGEDIRQQLQANPHHVASLLCPLAVSSHTRCDTTETP